MCNTFCRALLLGCCSAGCVGEAGRHPADSLAADRTGKGQHRNAVRDTPTAVASRRSRVGRPLHSHPLRLSPSSPPVRLSACPPPRLPASPPPCLPASLPPLHAPQLYVTIIGTHRHQHAPPVDGRYLSSASPSLGHMGRFLCFLSFDKQSTVSFHQAATAKSECSAGCAGTISS